MDLPGNLQADRPYHQAAGMAFLVVDCLHHQVEKACPEEVERASAVVAKVDVRVDLRVWGRRSSWEVACLVDLLIYLSAYN